MKALFTKPTLGGIRLDNRDIKKLLSESLARLCETDSIDRISVKQIYESCGVSKRTFYNHFIDKYDLMSWHWRNELKSMFEALGEKYSYRALMQNCYRSMAPGERNFSQIFRNAETTDAFIADCMRDSMDFFTMFLDRHDISVNPIKLRFLLEYHFAANGATLRSWATGKLQSTPTQLANWTIEAMPEELKRILKQAHAL